MQINKIQNTINFSQTSRKKKDNNTNVSDRVIVALLTTGVSTAIGEALYSIDRSNIKKSIKIAENDKVDFQKNLDKSEKDLEKYQKDFKSALKEKTNILNNIDNAAETESGNAEFKKVITHLNTNFYDKIESVNEGKQVIVPNCIMLSGQNTELNNRLINHIGKKSDCNFFQIEHKDNILMHLKKAEESYTKTGKRTLLYVNDFDQLINPETAPDHVIADLKNLMGKSSEKYHSTIIFSTKDTSKLDNVVLQPHRVERIDINIADADYEKIKPTIQKIEDLTAKIKPARQTIEDKKTKISPAIQKTNECKDKLAPFVKKTEELNTKLKNLKRTKVLIAAGIGFVAGTVGMELFRLININKSKQDKNF